MDKSKSAAPMIGVFFAIGTALATSLLGVFVHLAHQDFTTAETIAHRNFFMALVLLPMVWRQLPALRRKLGLLLWVRAGFGAVGMAAFFWCLQNGSVAGTAAIFSLVPVLVGFASQLLLKETYTKRLLIGSTLIAGAIMVLNQSGLAQLTWLVTGVGILGVLGRTGAFLTLRKIGDTHSAGLIIFLLSFVSFLGSLFFSPNLEKLTTGFFHPTLAAIAGCSLLTQFLLTKSYVYLPATLGSILIQLTVVLSPLMEFWLTGRKIELAEAACYGVVLLGVIIALGKNQRLARAS